MSDQGSASSVPSLGPLSRRDLPPLGDLRVGSQKRLRASGGGNFADSVPRRLRPLDTQTDDAPVGRATRLDFGNEPARTPARRVRALEDLGSSGNDSARRSSEDGFAVPASSSHAQLLGPQPYNNDPALRGTPRSPTYRRANLDGVRDENDGFVDSESSYPGAFPGAHLQIPKTPAGTRAMPLTPLRATFSPHAHGAAATSFAAAAEAPVPAADPPMTTMEELLSPHALQPYLPFFVKLGYVDLAAVLALDDDKTDWMLEEVEAEAENSGLRMKASLKSHITTRIKQERAKLAAAAASSEKVHEVDAKNLPVLDVGPATGNVIMLDGMKGLLRHWCCCVGLCVALVVVAVIFLVLYEKVGDGASGSGSSSGVNGGNVSNTSSGGWKFLYIVAILGPDIEGDCNSLCATMYKICCCQCKIQIA